MKIAVTNHQTVEYDTDDFATSYDANGKPVEWDDSLWPDSCRGNPDTWDDEQKERFKEWCIDYAQETGDFDNTQWSATILPARLND